MHSDSAILQTVARNMETVIIGKRPVIDLMLCCVLCAGHALIEDVPGVGKTSLAAALARSFSCSFRRIQFTPDILPSDITGFSVYNQKTGGFDYWEGAVMAQFVLADEINRTSPKTQSSLLEVMEEHQVTVDGVTYPVPEPFIVLATQNPVEYVGTYPLPEAQLDRFFMRISVGYPSEAEEADMLDIHKADSPLKALEPVAGPEELLHLQRRVRDITVEPSVRDYIVSLARSTRSHGEIALGASPRATMALYKASRALALYSGRDYVIPDDVKALAVPVLAHRVIIRGMYGKTDASQALVREVLKTVPVPTEALAQ